MATTKIVLITGGVVSSVGKGLVTSSLGYLLRSKGILTTCVKIDPYLNVDAGTMSPYEHGEVFVLKDGGQVDLDLGNYERFLGVTLTQEHSITSGKIFKEIIKKERSGHFLGKTIQFVPHVTESIRDTLLKVARKPLHNESKSPEICLVELGGTPNDMESTMFIESLRLTKFLLRDNFVHLHVTYIPCLSISGEQKSRPGQQALVDLRKAGLTPDFILCRSSSPVSPKIRRKLALVSMLPPEFVFSCPDVKCIFEVPLEIEKRLLPQLILEKLHLNTQSKTVDLNLAKDVVAFQERRKGLQTVTVAMVAKYSGAGDCYTSLEAALETAARTADVNLRLVKLDAEQLYEENESDEQMKKTVARKLEGIDGILIPGGFGNRGIEGKIKATQFARETNTPFLGICLGMQIAVIEIARHLIDLPHANSTEFSPDAISPVVVGTPNSDLTKAQSMRLGEIETHLEKDSMARRIYSGLATIHERHRHRYEINLDFIESFEKVGVRFTGRDSTGKRMHVVELPDKRFFLGVQFHPEFTSNPRKPSPCIAAFIQAVKTKLN